MSAQDLANMKIKAGPVQNLLEIVEEHAPTKTKDTTKVTNSKEVSILA